MVFESRKVANRVLVGASFHGILKAAALSIALGAVLAGCGQTGSVSKDLSLGGQQVKVPKIQSVLTVTDSSGAPIANAQILIGKSLNQPFSGNFIATDVNGQVAIPAGWSGPMPITIQAPGYVRTTFFDREPSDLTFAIHKSFDGKYFQITGETTNYSGLSDGKTIHVGLLLPMFSRDQLPGIELSALMSPEPDPVSVMGQQFQVPSNLSIPTQEADYILPVTISKPGFRLFARESGQKMISVVHASFLLDDVMGEIQNGLNIAKIANKVTFVGGSIRTAVAGPKTSPVKMPVTDMTFTPSINFTAPKYPANLSLAAIAVPENAGAFAVSDLKVIKPGAKGTLMAPRAGVAKGLVIALLREARQKESTVGVQNAFLSATIQSAALNQAPDVLDLVPAPEMRADTLVMTPPKAINGVEKTMTRATLSKIDVMTNGKYSYESKTPKWELYAADWTASMALPTWPTPDFVPGKGMRWETEFDGTLVTPIKSKVKAASESIGPNLVEKVTHVARSAVDL